MTTDTQTVRIKDSRLAQLVLDRIGADLAMITDHDVTVDDFECGRASERAAGDGKVHISFKQAYQGDGTKPDFGCVLMPLPEAISLAAFLMMVPDETVRSRRDDLDLDRMTKDALLEVANFLGGAVDGALREHLGDVFSVRSEGCQGVRASVRPAFPYVEGSPLLVIRAATRIHDFDAFEMIVMVPVLGEFMVPG